MLKEQAQEFYDISPEISEHTAVFPGDRPFSRNTSLTFEKGDHLTLSDIHCTAHIGAHVDAPLHYHSGGEAIHARSLSYYLGPCQVIEVKLPRDRRILPQDIQGVSILAKRVLFKTRSFPDPNQWNGDFNSLSPELVEDLAGKGVVLVGIDTPSVDPAQSKKLEAHQAIYKNNLALLEGIILDSVVEGVYDLVALPLKIRGADASPVRAILIKQAVL